MSLFRKIVYSDNIASIQDSAESIITNNEYDLSRLSDNELKTIIAVIECANKKYASSIRSAGLFNETYEIVYKARHILLQTIIERYKKSTSKVDAMACACAYAYHGAYYRQHALFYFEYAGGKIPHQISNLINISPPIVYGKFAELYEQEHQYEKAMKYVHMAREFANNPAYYKVVEERIRKKIENPPKRRKSFPKEKTIDFYNKLIVVSEQFKDMIR